MPLDPLSPTVITDWASDVLGRPMTDSVVSQMREWLDRRQSAFLSGRLRKAESPFADVVLLRKALPDDSGSTFYMAHQGGPFYDAGRLNPPAYGRNSRLRRRISHYRDNLMRRRKKGEFICTLDEPNLRHFPGVESNPKTGMPTLSKYTQLAYDFACSSLRELSSIEPLSHEQQRLLQQDFQRLGRTLRFALRAPERQVIRDVLAIADRDALTVMRRIRTFDNRLYAYMACGEDAEIRLRRRQFVLAFPALAQIVCSSEAASDLRRCVDKGMPLRSGEGLSALVTLLSAEAKTPISERPAKAYARMNLLIEGRDVVRQTMRWLGILNEVDPAYWPKPPQQRLGGSVAVALYAAAHGADIVRVHDVAETTQALKLWRALHETGTALP